MKFAFPTNTVAALNKPIIITIHITPCAKASTNILGSSSPSFFKIPLIQEYSASLVGYSKFNLA